MRALADWILGAMIAAALIAFAQGAAFVIVAVWR